MLHFFFLVLLIVSSRTSSAFAPSTTRTTNEGTMTTTGHRARKGSALDSSSRVSYVVPDDTYSMEVQRQFLLNKFNNNGHAVEPSPRESTPVVPTTKSSLAAVETVANAANNMILHETNTTLQIWKAPNPSAVSLVELRNDYLLEAASAGKSRWGRDEVQRIADQRNVELPTTTTTTTAPPVTLFQRRNRQVVDAAAAGKSRWGALEVEKATNGAVPTMPTTMNIPGSIAARDAVKMRA